MSTLDHWRFEADGGDWADVLRRAGTRRAVPRRVLLATAAALAVAAPAVALVTQTIGHGGGGRGPHFTAALRDASGVTAGTFTASVPNAFFTRLKRGSRTPRVFTPTRHGRRRALTLKLVWKLELRKTGTVSSLRLIDRHGSPIATLCAPCTSATRGRSEIRLQKAKFIFGPRGTVEAVVAGTTVSGPLVLRR